MHFLLDTHALIWWWLGDPKLSRPAHTAIRSADNTVFVSPVSAFEIALKVRSKHLPEMAEPLDQFDEAVARDGFTHLALRYEHGREAGLLRGEHRDPFDRLIAAQSLIENLTVITRDPQFTAFGCKVIW